MKLKLVKFKREPKKCVCLTCGLKQRFKSNGRYFKTIKDLSLDKPLKLKVEVLRAKCLSQACSLKSFTLLPRGIKKYHRATERLIQEALAGLINDNSTTPRIAKRLTRVFNTTGSSSAIDRWKHEQADKIDIKEIITKLSFSGILCIDEYKPRRYKGYDLIDSDGLTGRILYLEKAEGLGRV